MNGDPYRRCGLARNPFIVEATPGVDPSLFLDRGFPPAPASGARRFVQIIGERGAGKTTLILHWRRQLAGPYRHVAPGLPRFLPVPLARGIVYWDEADRIPSLILHASLRIAWLRGATIVAGTHVDLSASARGAGFSVETFAFSALTADDVMRWSAARIAGVATSPETLSLAPDDARIFAERSGSSWRVAGDLLHAWAAAGVQEFR